LLSTYLVLALTSACVVQAHVEREQMDCHLTQTTAETHKMIRDNLAETPVYGGWVDSKGPRYCPSIEDKIVRFADKQSHQVIPTLYYPNLGYFLLSCLLRLGLAGIGIAGWRFLLVKGFE